MTITSLENEKIKNLIKLQMKKYRDLTSTYLVEGEHLVEEAIKAGVCLEVFLLENEECSFSPCTYVSCEVMKKLSMMDTPSTMIAYCKKRKQEEIVGNKILLLDEIQDPGNLGTIIRSSVAFGVDTIILSENTVDLYNPKVLRSTQGMHFHIPILSMDSMEAASFMKEHQIPLYGTNVEDGVKASELSSSQKEKYCLVMGNEGNGVRRELQDICDLNLYIPMNEQVESLNVGVACSILLYELNR